MSESPTLPHRPYIDAVLDALGDLAPCAVLAYQGSQAADPASMTALIELDDEEHDEELGRTIVTQLSWSAVGGWTYAYKCSDMEEVCPESLLSGVVPTPVAVADAARLAAHAGGDRLPLPAAETPAHPEPLPALPAQAAHEQGLVSEVAARLVVYAVAQ